MTQNLWGAKRPRSPLLSFCAENIATAEIHQFDEIFPFVIFSQINSSCSRLAK